MRKSDSAHLSFEIDGRIWMKMHSMDVAETFVGFNPMNHFPPAGYVGRWMHAFCGDPLNIFLFIGDKKIFMAKKLFRNRGEYYIYTEKEIFGFIREGLLTRLKSDNPKLKWFTTKPDTYIIEDLESRYLTHFASIMTDEEIKIVRRFLGKVKNCIRRTTREFEITEKEPA